MQPGFARLPKPITQGTLNYVVFEWFPCVTPEPEKHLIPVEILMEYLSDQCKLTLTRTEKTLKNDDKQRKTINKQLNTLKNN